ncbi:hypothetical protein CC85DRAFT_282508 [Cutaneotrichosporon oleaginosum]|uniref:GRF-type domain-containing protein n=1 Tax=Cutaneotrichosporon oleaginosum TaxID=879819 RepID=A0A0J0XWI7_9TREE|nr:uncharacterized protein CC85DRAFT_282508 [Cutaneotrichosporon oleaginosum]KLT45430.1 hypothetical protein CC85DRAFT_282508 [Cutaneotrichosporon oleaginosum]TXT14609.1 hypothetical protein COLE_00802 [Cutaneotrichosporon oleaginosum]
MALTRTAPTRTVTGTEGIKCDGHKLAARKFQAGPTSKNPGRWFYTCPLPREDAQRCKFFKWADDTEAQGQTLGASPARLVPTVPTTPSRLMRPTGSALHTPAKAHPHSPAPALSSASRTPTHVPQRRESDGEIDWESIDADGLERDAEARVSPRSSQTVQARLEAVSPLVAKRKLSAEEDGERTPKRAAHTGNPFLATPTREHGTPTHSPFSVGTPGSEVGVGRAQHPALGSMLTAMGEVGDHLARQERLVRAAESMKRSMRTTIQNLQERVKTLEAELAAERAKNQ